jgi:hypothetical protein
MNTPRVLRRYVASMAFNFSAVPERAPLPQGNQPEERHSSPYQLLRFFGQANVPAIS